MGRMFIAHPGGNVIYSCQSCDTPLTNKDQLVSTKFTGATGKAYLFTQVLNITEGKAEERPMITGKHIVRDVYCRCCSYKLGWMYEFAHDEGQLYKEGKVILERALIKESQGIDSDYGDENIQDNDENADDYESTDSESLS